MPKIYDNIENLLTKGLNETLNLSVRSDFCVGYFNLRGWKEVTYNIDKLTGSEIQEGDELVHRTCRLLVGMHKMPVEIIREAYNNEEPERIDINEAFKIKKRLALEFKEQLTIGTPTENDELALRNLSRQLKQKKVVVKLHLSYPLHAKLYLAYSNDVRVPIVGFLGSSNLTLAGLSKQGELNVDVLEQDASDKLAKWFNDRWEDRYSFDITEELIEIIDNSWAADRLLSPYHIYLKIAYHLSQEARAGLNEFKIPRQFRNELLPFQQAAVQVAAKKLHSRDGVYIGDVVGLGKTYTACAIAKIYEEDFFFSTLIICPPNLVEMWEDYIRKFDLKANVISVGQVQTKLPELKRFKLVIIDESHNLRNDQGRRYKAIKDYLIENNSKVILLSATPYNKTYLDLSNQLRLFIPDDKDLGISPDIYISNIGGQVQFSAKHSDTFIRSIKAFEKSDYSDDWKELMRLYLVRRTRSFIKENYAKNDPERNRKYLEFSDGRRSYFPDRIPKKAEFYFKKSDPDDQYAMLYSDDVVNSINNLELPRYGIGNYLMKNPALVPTSDEVVIIDNLSRAGKRLMGFCRTNLFKRLESSGYSFLMSLCRHVLRNYVFFYAIQNNLPVPIGKNITNNFDDYLEDLDPDNNDSNDENNDDNRISFLTEASKYLENAEKVYIEYQTTLSNYFDWIRSEFFDKKILKKLSSDCHEILEIVKIAKNWNPDEDRKIISLIKLLTQKHPDEKIIIFTQYADTAEYLHENLKRLAIKNLDCVTGNSENPTSVAHRFSPVSNGFKPALSDIRVLISTDVLSEGQNLQDAHIVVNYDLPWALIRLIQRAGRVDRIGQVSDKILCYSFLPEEGINNIIKLRDRLKRRIMQNAEVVGTDEVFFDGDPVNLEDLYNEKSGVLDDDESDAEVDLSSYAYQIWENAIKENPELKKLIPDMPNVVYATKHKNSDKEKQGVIVYTRTADENDILIRIDDDNNIIPQSQLAILKSAECKPDVKPEDKLPAHHDLVKHCIKHVKDDEKNTGGSLGKKTGAKYRVYMKLDRFCKDNEGTLFVTDSLKKAVDDIFKYPLREFAKDVLNRQLKSGISDSDLAELVKTLREDDKLCITNLDEIKSKDPQIICSMGLKNKK